MLIEKEYEKNSRGIILEREIVEIKCDICGRTWEVSYSSRKRKTLSKDLCRSCRCNQNLSGIENRKKQHQKISFICAHCGTKYERIPSLVCGNAHFCSRDCHHEFDINQRYGHLEKVFIKRPHHVSYLIGVILGDGHITKKEQKRTSTVIVAFDCSQKWVKLLEFFKNTLRILQIKWTESKIRKNCKTINFVLPDYILKKFGILYCGDKFAAQPCPNNIVINNIHYAVGLLNSDGQFVFYANKNYSSSYRFCNTVESITNSLSKCLHFNKIEHSKTYVKGRFSKRTGKVNRPQFNLYIGKNNVDRLHELCLFPIKGKITIGE